MKKENLSIFIKDLDRANFLLILSVFVMLLATLYIVVTKREYEKTYDLLLKEIVEHEHLDKK